MTEMTLHMSLFIGAITTVVCYLFLYPHTFVLEGYLKVYSDHVNNNNEYSRNQTVPNVSRDVGLLFNPPQSDKHEEKDQENTTRLNDELSPTDISDSKLVLVWTEQDESKLHIPKKTFCEYKCEFTSNKSLHEEASIICFDNDDIPISNWPKRSSKQLFLHMLEERPGPWHEWLKNLDGKINVTLNYRRSADISTDSKVYIPRFVSLNGTYKPSIPMRDKNFTVLWVVSHCNAESLRDDYVAELSKYISVHIYGKCGNFSCWPPDNPPNYCSNKFSAEYKFYLSFENAICDEYVTEKLHVPLSLGLIPIVLGKVNYTFYAPPNSFIDVQDFNSPKDLADHLNFLVANENEYNKYLEWNNDYIPGMEWLNVPCLICKAAYESKYWRPAHSHYRDWWFKGCDNGLVNRMRAKGNW